MDREIHYYVNFLLSLQAGFSKQSTYKIAFSSQYIDDNTRKYRVLNLRDNVYYNNIATQTLNPLLEYDDLCLTYICFHFIPGTTKEISDSTKKRLDEQQNIFNTIAGGRNANLLLKYALNSKDQYHIGIASHMYLDTWAHQNFTGTLDKFNCIDIMPCRLSIDSLAEKIGHMDALLAPDLVGKVWHDYRLKRSMVNNNQRFLEAINALLKKYQIFLHKNNNLKRQQNKSIQKLTNKKFLKHITEIWSIRSNSKRIKEYQKYSKEVFDTELPLYNKDLWFNSAIKK